MTTLEAPLTAPPLASALTDILADLAEDRAERPDHAEVYEALAAEALAAVPGPAAGARLAAFIAQQAAANHIAAYGTASMAAFLAACDQITRVAEAVVARCPALPRPACRHGGTARTWLSCPTPSPGSRGGIMGVHSRIRARHGRHHRQRPLSLDDQGVVDWAAKLRRESNLLSVTAARELAGLPPAPPGVVPLPAPPPTVEAMPDYEPEAFPLRDLLDDDVALRLASPPPEPWEAVA